jgi:hypothetical protein
MPSSPELANVAFNAAISQIQEILNSKHHDATGGEKVVRIAWVIGNLPTDVRETVINEAQNRVTIGWATGMKPTNW